jgi:hypothetical protein
MHAVQYPSTYAMVPTIFPDIVDYMGIAMEERARIRDKMPSAIPIRENYYPGTATASDDDPSKTLEQ